MTFQLLVTGTNLLSSATILWNGVAIPTPFVRKVRPALLSYDSYSLFEATDRSLFLGNMQTIARAAARDGTPFMSIVQGSRFGTKSAFSIDQSSGTLTPVAGRLIPRGQLRPR